MNNRLPEKDLFGNEVKEDVLLRDKFIEPPFSVLDTKSGSWQKRKRLWMQRGIRGEVGRGDSLVHIMPTGKYNGENMEEEYYGKEAQKLNTSIFDPALTELLYHWFCSRYNRGIYKSWNEIL